MVKNHKKLTYIKIQLIIKTIFRYISINKQGILI